MRRARALALGLSLAACGDDGGTGTECTPFDQVTCYEGPPETDGVGACRFGIRTCQPDGETYSDCTSQVLPTTEDCGTALDDDCDGEVNEGCECVPGTVRICYTGPQGTLGLGTCVQGTQWCNEDGSGLGPCLGEVLPSAELCDNNKDDDCDGVVNQAEACECSAGDVEACYSGPDGTEGVGVCVAGTRTCLPQGGSFGPCVGEVLPGTESCSTDEDDDCNGQSNEPAAGCTCTPGEQRACYSGPSGTSDQGICQPGTQTCEPSGDGFGACNGDVTPLEENCATPEDDDCDGEANEEEEGCECTPGEQALCYTGPEFTLNVGTCQAGSRICSPSGLWFACEDEVVPADDDCNTPLDENCDGAVNEPSSGCVCSLEDPTTLQSEDCVLDFGEPAWKMPIIGLPHELGADFAGNTYLVAPHEVDHLDFEPVPAPLLPTAMVARYGPNGELYWGKELTGSVSPLPSAGHSYNLSVAESGAFALTLPINNGDTTGFGGDTFTWPNGSFRVLLSVEPWGFPLFAVAVPRYSLEPNSSIHAVAATGDGSVYYMNGPTENHLHHYDWFGDLSWTVDVGLDLDDFALAPTDDGGVLLLFTTGLTVNLGTGLLLPLPGSSSDLILARYDASGTLLTTHRPFPAATVLSAREDAGVLSVVGPNLLYRLDAFDGTLLSVDALPGVSLPGVPFTQVGGEAVLVALNDAGTSDLGLGDVDPYGGQATGPFLALLGVGGTRWVRAPLCDQVAIGAGAPDLVFAACKAETELDLDGTLVPLMDPAVYLARLAY